MRTHWYHTAAEPQLQQNKLLCPYVAVANGMAVILCAGVHLAHCRVHSAAVGRHQRLTDPCSLTLPWAQLKCR